MSKNTETGFFGGPELLLLLGAEKNTRVLRHGLVGAGGSEKICEGDEEHGASAR